MSDNLILANEWINRAESSLEKAKLACNSSKIANEDICFDAQQSVEKALKGLLIFLNIEFQKTHSINKLTSYLKQNNVYIPTALKDISILTEYAVETRYPGDYEPINKDETITAIELAESALKWVKDLISNKSMF